MSKKKNKKYTESHALLELAVNCKLLTTEQEKEYLPQLLDFFKKNPNASISAYLVKNQILTKDNVQFLYSVRKHLELLMADKKFGRLGVANQFVAPDKVKKALDLQVSIFKKRQKSVKIGDILVQNNDISVADKTALLLTQDRIKDELLADALNAMGKSEIERLAISKRFGAIAVKKEMVDTKQLNQALKAQKKEAQNTEKKRPLGEFFKEMFGMSESDIMTILKIQKKLETKRMNLEKKLIEYNTEKKSNQDLDDIFEYHVTGDRLKAFVHQIQATEQKTALPDFLNWFNLSGIHYGLSDASKIQAFLARNKPDSQLEIASGKAPVPFKNESIEYHFDIRFYDDQERETHETEQSAESFEQETVRDAPLVKKDDVLATLTPHQEAQPGIDVFGRPIYLPEEPAIFLGAGQGVVKQNNQFVAAVPGHPKLFKNRTLFITPALDGLPTHDIEGDITDDANDEYLVANLNVKGNIVPGIHLACHHLTIEGDIMGNVTATGNIDINGNIGQINSDVEGQPEPCQVEAKGRIRINQKIINANIIARQGFNAPNSDLVSSRIHACGDIILNNVFSSKNAPSALRVTRENALEINQLVKKIKALKAGLDRLSHKPEMNQLTKELMEQIQVQNGYLEKQNVMLYLNRVLNKPFNPRTSTKAPQSIEQKIAAYKEKVTDKADNLITIPENTKAHRFMMIIAEKLAPLNEIDQKQYVSELYENISGMYKAAVKVTQRIQKKYEARSEMIEQAVERSQPHMIKIQSKIVGFVSQKDLLQHEITKTQHLPRPVIKIKNQAGKETIILGEKARLDIKESIYRVSLKEKIDPMTQKVIIAVDGFNE